MKDALEDPPIGYAEFRIQGKDGVNAFTAKAYTYADLAKIVGFMPVGLMFEVHLYCNEIPVGNALYRRHNPHVESLQESGACVNLLRGEFPALPALDTPLS